MNYIRLLSSSSLLLWTCLAFSQALGPEQIVKQALAVSPSVQAQGAIAQARQNQARSVGSGANPELELSPGLGFTNSNFVLGQSFDLSGRRAAQTRVAEAEAKEARADLGRVRLRVAESALTVYADYLWATESEAAASQGVEAAKKILAGVQKRVDLGEAPAVQRTRAEVELLRAEQAHTEAKAKLATNLAALQVALGLAPNQLANVEGWLSAEVISGDIALKKRPEALAARARLEAAKAGEAEARSLGRPSLFAGIAADTWGLNRDPFRSENLGFQVSLKMPILDRGENRFATRAAELVRKAREADITDTERQIRLEFDQATITLEAARQVAGSYSSGILPKAEEMLFAMRQGYESGLTNFLEVLEAQQTLVRLRREAADAARALRLAEVRYLAVTAQLPGLETNP